jgi:hypothetical protein
LSREELHALVDAVCDARERARSANSRQAAVQASAEVIELGDRLTLGAVGRHKSQRLGAALDAQHVFDISRDDHDAVALGQREFGPDLLCSKAGITAVRRMLTRALMDCPWLPRWLVFSVVEELLWANFGGDMKWLSNPTRPPGMKPFHAPKTYLDATMLTRVHYSAGYHGETRETAAGKVLNDPTGARWERLQRIGRELKTKALCDQNYQKGEADRAAGRPFNPPMGAHYDAVELETARRELGEQTETGGKTARSA